MKLGLDVDGSVAWRIVWMMSVRQREELDESSALDSASCREKLQDHPAEET